MSLLLEALKKAELAKQGRKPEDDEPADALQLEPVPTKPLAATPPVITRQELPDISQPLEILTEDLPSASGKKAVDEATVDRIAARAVMEPQPLTMEAPPEPPPRPAHAVEPESEAAPAPAASARASTPPAQEPAAAAERDAARQLFEAKEVEHHPKRNFYITVGVLLAIGAGYAGYVWWQMQPKYSYAPAAVQNAPKGAPTAASPPAPQQQLAAPLPPAPVAATPAAAAPAKPPAAAQTEQPTAAKPPEAVFLQSDADRTAVARTPARQAAGGSAPITVNPPALTIDPQVERGFELYQLGDLTGAREAYQQALQRSPRNRDALLGLAAIDVRMRRFETAEVGYIRMLELDPRDVDAQAGLIALRGQVDPVQSESRLKTLIAANPDASGLYFPLGNQYAQQSLWAEAQSAYFKAYAGDPENADYAFNLAVSLDRLRQKALALQYYQRAMKLAANRPAGFDLAQVRIRIQELQRR